MRVERRRRSSAAGVTAKDIILAIIGEIGTAGGTGHVIEYAGEAIRALSMEGRMTVCNMSIEGGARAGLIAPDEKTFDYLKGRPKAPKGAALGRRRWPTGRRWPPTRAPSFDREVEARRRRAAADRLLGHQPGGRGAGHRPVPDPDEIADERQRAAKRRALEYMGLKAGTPITDIADRQGVHRLLHQWPHRGPARGRRDRRGPQGR